MNYKIYFSFHKLKWNDNIFRITFIVPDLQILYVKTFIFIYLFILHIRLAMIGIHFPLLNSPRRISLASYQFIFLHYIIFLLENVFFKKASAKKAQCTWQNVLCVKPMTTPCLWIVESSQSSPILFLFFHFSSPLICRRRQDRFYYLFHRWESLALRG